MSTNNAARFYWGKLERATASFDAGKLDEAQEICLQLGNEFRCPRFCQVEAWMLHSRCFPDNYWFAKSSLDLALGICVSCESYEKATERDLAALADVKKSFETMLRNRATEYREHWESKGREPPTQDEWYDIAEAEAEAGESADEWIEVMKDEDGKPISGPVEAWPFGGPVPSSFLEGKIFPPEAKVTAQEMQKPEEHERQHNEEQDIKPMNVPEEEKSVATEDIVQVLRQLASSMGMDVDE